MRTGSPEWHAVRRTGIGGSDAAAVLGLSPWRTPYDVYAEKIGEGDPQPENEAMRWGTLLEPVIRRRYAEIIGLAVHERPLIRSGHYEWLICHPDGIVDDGRLLEIKTARTSEGYGEPGTDEVPQHYLLQVHHNLIATAAPRADLAVLIGGSDLRIYTIEPDPAIHANLIEIEAAFWACVQRRDPPWPASLADAQARWGRISAKGCVIADSATIEAVEHARSLKRAIKSYTEALESSTLAIVSALAARGDTLVDDAGHVLATWRMNKGRAGYTVQPLLPSRQLRIKGESNE